MRGDFVFLVGIAFGLLIAIVDKLPSNWGDTEEVLKCPHGFIDWDECPTCCH